MGAPKPSVWNTRACRRRRARTHTTNRVEGEEGTRRDEWEASICENRFPKPLSRRRWAENQAGQCIAGL